MTEPTKPSGPLTDADLSRLVTLVVIHEGESSSMRDESAMVLHAAGLVERSDGPSWYGCEVTDSGRALVERMLVAGRATSAVDAKSEAITQAVSILYGAAECEDAQSVLDCANSALAILEPLNG